ncbi:gluconokinase [Paenibacillus nasutitermitis]|uniref:Gluconate kinase n=1 Tax=Paenibacillus nasutitermitis TaxID=1652958 RepID=A0A916Z223_9BACL|nr:gluconokinase [Paenibacillus nasutitermitis]GGD72230.1 gluconate kinase [Paenibacillus nasutitermitis]
MPKEYVIGLDIGTTSVKACVFHTKGKLIAAAEELIASYYPHQGWAEQNPAEIERSAVLAVSEAIRQAGIDVDELISIGFSAAMHSLIVMDKGGRPLSPALIWADGRSSDQAEQLTKSVRVHLYEKTGTPVHPMTPFVKLLWMKETGYEPYLNADSFMSIKEYLIYCWFGERKIDYSMASATGLFNPATLDWEPELLSLAGISAKQLSAIVPPTTKLYEIRPDIAQQMGIPGELPFVIGAADGQLSNLGIGAILPGEVAVSVGTSGAIRQFTDHARVSPSQETFCYSFTGETFIVGGPTNNGGIALQWLKNLLQDEGSFESFLAAAEQVGPGAEGLFFLPYLNGERAPLWNQRARGNFHGIAITHKKAHFVRAVLEGITFNLYQIGRALEKLAGSSAKIYVNGGLARSPLWLQMMADIFDAEIYVSENHHSAAWGAAWTALVALGQVHSFEDIKRNIPMDSPVIPNKANCDRYQSIYAQYEKLANNAALLF